MTTKGEEMGRGKAAFGMSFLAPKGSLVCFHFTYTKMSPTQGVFSIIALLIRVFITNYFIVPTICVEENFFHDDPFVSQTKK